MVSLRLLVVCSAYASQTRRGAGGRSRTSSPTRRWRARRRAARRRGWPRASRCTSRATAGAAPRGRRPRARCRSPDAIARLAGRRAGRRLRRQLGRRVRDRRPLRRAQAAEALRRVQRRDAARARRGRGWSTARCGASSGSALSRAPIISRCPSFPKSRRSAATWRPTSRGARCSALEVLDERWSRPLAARRAGRGGRGPRGRAAGAARQVPGLGALGRRLPAHAPADDRHAAARPAPARRRTRACGCGSATTSSRSPTRGASAPASWRSAATRSTRSSPPGSASSRSTSEFTGAHLYALARTSRAPIKAFLLDQKRVAGVGNIYADEALFRARDPPAAAGQPAHARAVRRRCATRSSSR